jgi:eukaryotic-like serine/threonine-protein kinase
MIRKGPPKNNRAFIWPFDLVDNGRFCGYVMPLIEKRFIELKELLYDTVKPSFRTLTTVGFHLAQDLLAFHADGLCYSDLNMGNVQCDFEQGDVVLLDNDNVTTNGNFTGIYPPPNFTAPELFRQQAPPNTQTDLYSLAVLLFYVFMVHHPLDGKRGMEIKYDEQGMKDLYGDHPVFIFDPQDDSNRPDPECQRNALVYWRIYPQFLRDLFVQAFTVGLRQPYSRITETTWMDAMSRLRDSIFHCPQCRSESFYDVDYLQKSPDGRSAPCWNQRCLERAKLPPRLRLGSGVNQVIMLEPEARLYPHHLNNEEYDFSRPLAEVSASPLGLRNLSKRKWMAQTPGREQVEILPGASLPLLAGTRIDFGLVRGEIKI